MINVCFILITVLGAKDKTLINAGDVGFVQLQDNQSVLMIKGAKEVLPIEESPTKVQTIIKDTCKKSDY